jgi:hypothetical protein
MIQEKNKLLEKKKQEFKQRNKKVNNVMNRMKEENYYDEDNRRYFINYDQVEDKGPSVNIDYNFNNII